MNCVVCDQHAGKKCIMCKTPYCSRVCQRDDWDNYGHQNGCLLIGQMQCSALTAHLRAINHSMFPHMSGLEKEFRERFALSNRGEAVKSTELWKRFKKAKRKVSKKKVKDAPLYGSVAYFESFKKNNDSVQKK